MESREKILSQSINRLDIADSIIIKLTQNGIDTLGELCKRSKKDLNKIGIQQYEAKLVDIELQLMGLSLKGSL